MKKLIKKLTKELTLFKIIVIILGVIFILKLSDISKNGRYIPRGDNYVIDTRTGNVYYLDYNNKYDFEKPQIPIHLRD